MEFTFKTVKMRAVAFDRKAAQKSLGSDLVEAFYSLVADLGNAVHFNEMVDPPAAIQPDPVILEYRFGSDCILQVQPTAVHNIDLTNWTTAYRAKLVCVVKNGTQVI